ncbi:hypothetical protein ECG_01440 [Echinococcus granulosus]|nr:hypothetical protein ECG_01440 [Echinococcus granulosus]
MRMQAESSPPPLLPFQGTVCDPPHSPTFPQLKHLASTLLLSSSTYHCFLLPPNCAITVSCTRMCGSFFHDLRRTAVVVVVHVVEGEAQEGVFTQDMFHHLMPLSSYNWFVGLLVQQFCWKEREEFCTDIFYNAKGFQFLWECDHRVPASALSGGRVDAPPYIPCSGKHVNTLIVPHTQRGFTTSSYLYLCSWNVLAWPHGSDLVSSFPSLLFPPPLAWKCGRLSQRVSQ